MKNYTAALLVAVSLLLWMLPHAATAENTSVENKAEDTSEDASEEATQFDVVLLVDGSEKMAPLSRKSAMVVVEAMSDAHRLGIFTFGQQATVLRSLGPIATVKEKMAALQTLNDATFDAASVDLTIGLQSAMAALVQSGAQNTHRVIVLLIGGPSAPVSEAEKEQFKRTVAPALLKHNIRLFVVAKEEADIPLLQQTANLTGGKLLAAFDVNTMTDALDSVVEKLAPPKQVLITKEVPIKKTIIQTTEETADEKLARNQAASRQLFVIVSVGCMLGLLLIGVLLLQYRMMRRISLKDAPERKTAGDKTDKSGFAQLRDLANALNNTVVDASEMVEQLNLDLEDFGVEKWRTEKGLVKQFGDLAAGLFLILDHLALQRHELDDETAEWVRQKISRLMEDAGIEKMGVDVGDMFDGLHHKHVAEETSDKEKGSILSVERPGYVVTDPVDRNEKMVLRQAEVVVSVGNEIDEKAN